MGDPAGHCPDMLICDQSGRAAAPKGRSPPSASRRVLNRTETGYQLQVNEGAELGTGLGRAVPATPSATSWFGAHAGPETLRPACRVRQNNAAQHMRGRFLRRAGRSAGRKDERAGQNKMIPRPAAAAKTKKRVTAEVRSEGPQTVSESS